MYQTTFVENIVFKKKEQHRRKMKQKRPTTLDLSSLAIESKFANQPNQVAEKEIKQDGTVCGRNILNF
jgi:hypothetical protein